MPNSAITRVSGLEIVPSPTNPNNGFYPPQLTQTQIDDIPEETLERGGIVYNTTTGTLQTYDQNDNWVNFYASASGEVVAVNHTTATQPTAANGLIYYNTNNNQFYATLGGAYKVLYATSDLTGVLVATVVANTAALPGAPANGMVVYQTDIGALKVYNGAWLTIYAAPVTATGVGLVSGKPFQLPTGPAGNVEVAANQVAGFTYLNTTASKLKFWTGTAWETITSA